MKARYNMLNVTDRTRYSEIKDYLNEECLLQA